jgi:hypothetical protein
MSGANILQILLTEQYWLGSCPARQTPASIKAGTLLAVDALEVSDLSVVAAAASKGDSAPASSTRQAADVTDRECIMWNIPNKFMENSHLALAL